MVTKMKSRKYFSIKGRKTDTPSRKTGLGFDFQTNYSNKLLYAIKIN